MCVYLIFLYDSECLLYFVYDSDTLCLLCFLYDSENVNVCSIFSLIMKINVFSILLYGSDNVCLLYFLYDSDNGSLTLYLHSFVLSDAFLLNVRTPDAFLM